MTDATGPMPRTRPTDWLAYKAKSLGFPGRPLHRRGQVVAFDRLRSGNAPITSPSRSRLPEGVQPRLLPTFFHGRVAQGAVRRIRPAADPAVYIRSGQRTVSVNQGPMRGVECSV